MKNTVIAIGVVVAIVVGVSFVSPYTFAQDMVSPKNSLVEKLASTFNLDKTKVQAVFDQEFKAHHAERQAKFEEKLTQLVKDGKISEAQKQLLLQKHQQMQESRQEQMEKMKSMTVEERKAAMEAHKKELENWAKENDIDVQDLFPMGGKMMRHWK